MIKIARPSCPNHVALANGNYKAPLNKEALKSASFGKCMYCESKIPHIDHAHVEHIKPKATGKFPHLKFVWENLGYCCAKCNGSKSDKYDASTPYINPYDENPEDHLVFLGWLIYSKRGSERGDLTIFDISLNRPELVERRKERIEKILAAINGCFRTKNQHLRDAAIKSLIQESEPNKEYSFAVKSVLKLQSIIP